MNSESRPFTRALDATQLKYDDRGLLPVVVQDEQSGAVLMVAWANQEAVEKTLATGQAHFYSRSREELWRKGETSGNTLEVRQVLEDCDRDTLLVRARPAGPACHNGTRTCFEPNPARLELGWLWQILGERASVDSDSSYTRKLLEAGVDRIARKVGEEAAETIIAAIRLDAAPEDEGLKRELVGEVCDVVYHLLVLMRSLDVEPDELSRELLRRHAEKTEKQEGAK